MHDVVLNRNHCESAYYAIILPKIVSEQEKMLRRLCNEVR